MKINSIKSQIKKLSKDFGLKYNPKWFNYIWISKRDEIILQYIGNCLDSVYDKYGDYDNGRIKNISKFFKNDLKRLSKRYGGEVYSIESLVYQKKIIANIKDKSIRTEILKLLNKIKKHLTNKKIALITRTNIKNEYKDIMGILRHEWLHILLFQNNIEFGKINNKLWMYDEGLCTYFESYIDGTINQLGAKVKARQYPYEKKYFVYAIKFRELLKNKKTSTQRKNTILRLYESFK